LYLLRLNESRWSHHRLAATARSHPARHVWLVRFVELWRFFAGAASVAEGMHLVVFRWSLQERRWWCFRGILSAFLSKKHVELSSAGPAAGLLAS